MSKTDNKIEKKPLITIIDFLGGAAAGVTQILVGQPFDIVKVRMQCNGGSAMENVKEIAKGGPLAFYKGTLSPLLAMSFCIALQFSGNNFAQRFIAKHKYDGKTEKLQLHDLMLAGFFSGFCYTWVLSPMELFRIKMQVQSKEGVGPKYLSSIDAGVKIFREQGIRGSYFGYFGSTVRECFGSAIYFGVYESLMLLQLPKYNNNRKEVPTWKIMLFGGLAGFLLWTAVYPADIIKTRQQGSNFTNTPYRSFLRTGKTLFKEKGFAGMYSGLIPCQLRAIVVNAASFVVYEFTVDLLKKMRKTHI